MLPKAPSPKLAQGLNPELHSTPEAHPICLLAALQSPAELGGEKAGACSPIG